MDDWFLIYPGGDPSVSSNLGLEYCVLRGGSWLGNRKILRVSYRNGGFLGDPNDDVGFVVPARVNPEFCMSKRKVCLTARNDSVRCESVSCKEQRSKLGV